MINSTSGNTNGNESSLVKVAVQMANQEGLLTVIDQKKPLQSNIEDFLVSWSIQETADQFVLQFDGQECNFVNEKNRNEIKDGTMLLLTHSPARRISDLLQTLKESNTMSQERREIFEKLTSLCSHSTFANEFCGQGGLSSLISCVESSSNEDEWLAAALEIFAELTSQTIIGWDCLTKSFVDRIVNIVNSSTDQNKRILINALIILEDILLLSNDCSFIPKIGSEITLPNLLAHVQHPSGDLDAAIQHNCIALVNALFLKSNSLRRKTITRTLSSKQYRNLILNHILNRGPGVSIGSEMAHQLYVLQSNFLSIHYERTCQFDAQEVIDICNELCKIAFENELNYNTDTSQCRAKSTYSAVSGMAESYVKLGFIRPQNPIDDFKEEPRLLTLDLMLYFATNYSDNYVKVVLENCSRSDKEHECPFVRSSIEITKLLIKIVNLGETPCDEGQQFHTLFFTHDHPLEELFSICVPLLNKTWKEMRATVEDFNKVFSVLRQQLIEAFKNEEDTASFEQLRKRLSSLTYGEILNIWQKQKNSREEWENNSASIVELRSMLTPNLLDVVKQHRIQFLTDGTRFVKYSNKGQRLKDKYWFCRLSNKSKVLFYGDCEDDQIPSIEHLPYKLPIVDIRSFAIGKDCPHMKDSKSKKSTFQLAFSLITDGEEQQSLNFVAPDERTFNYWVDGLNSLLGNRMTSKEVDSDLELLLAMEMKLKLLETEGYEIPDVPPEIPPPCPNYDFNTLST